MFATTLVTAMLVWQADPLALFDTFERGRPSVLSLVLDAAVAEPDHKAIRKAFASDPWLFAYLHRIGEVRPAPKPSKALRRALDDETGRRVSCGAAGWQADGRLDFLVEGAVLARTADPDAVRDALSAAATLVRKVVADRKPTLIERKDPDGKPWEGQLKRILAGLEDRKQVLEIATDLEIHNTMKPIALFEKIAIDSFERYGIICFRDGLEFKTQRLNRGLIKLDNSIVLSNGPVDLDECNGTVVICDGTLRFDKFFCDASLFIANGSIFSDGPLGGHSTFIARDKIKVIAASSTKRSTLIAGEEIDVVKRVGGEFGTHTIVGKGKFDPGVRFFAAADVGLAWKEVDGKVIVVSVAADSPLRKVLQLGDRINSINDKFFAEFDDARRVLREACVVGYAFINRTRDGQHARVLVDLQGYPKPLKAK